MSWGFHCRGEVFLGELSISYKTQAGLPQAACLRLACLRATVLFLVLVGVSFLFENNWPISRSTAKSTNRNPNHILIANNISFLLSCRII